MKLARLFSRPSRDHGEQHLALLDVAALFDRPFRDEEIDSRAIVSFIGAMKAIEAPRVVEIGTRIRPEATQSTRHTDMVPHAAEFLGVDYIDGRDVDIVADAHKLSDVLPSERYDGLISVSSLEHVKYPWLVAFECAKVLKVGGHMLIQTVHTFAVHGAPYDYWRFSPDGLRLLFNETLGLSCRNAHDQFPAWLISRSAPEQASRHTPLASVIHVEKTAPTPERYTLDDLAAAGERLFARER